MGEIDEQARPVLSVVVTVVEGPARLRGCLAALSRQVGAPDFEVVVPVDARFEAADSVLGSARIERAPGWRTPAELRSLGVGRARGAIVALIEDHCTPAPDWCAEIARAHAGTPVAVGGAVDKGQPDGTTGWALYFADYVRYMGPFDEGPARDLTDCNVSYKRAALDAIGEVWTEAFHEANVHEALRDRGGVLWRSPRIVVRSRRAVSWRQAVSDRYTFGRLFGATRPAARTLGIRMYRGIGWVALVPLLVARSLSHVLRTRRAAAAFVRALPALVALDAVWAWGELIGSVTGRPRPAEGSPTS